MCSRALFAAVRSGDVTRVTQSLQRVAFHFRGPVFVDKCRDARRLPALVVAIECGFVQVVELLLAAKANIHEEYLYWIIANWRFFSRTPLMIAAHYGHTDIVELLLSSGVDVDATAYSDGSALLLAAEAGHVQVVKALVNAGASIDYVNTYHNSFSASALALAASKGHADVVTILLEAGASVEIETPNQRVSALTFAAIGGHAAVVDQLLYRRSPRVVCSRWSLAMALVHAMCGRFVEIVDMLLAVEVEVEGYTDTINDGRMKRVDRKVRTLLASEGLTCSVDAGVDARVKPALATAIENGLVDVTELLLDLGADIEKLHDRSTPMLIAAQRGHFAIVELLLSRGADVSIQTYPGETPLMVASAAGHTCIVERLLEAAADGVDSIVQHVNHSAPFSANGSALLTAAKNGHSDIVELLLAAGANTEIAVDTGPSALSLAAMGGHGDVVKKLLDCGAQVNSTWSGDRSSPLVHASTGGYLSVVDLLLAAGANVNQASRPKRRRNVAAAANSKRTALVAAAANGEALIVERLLAAGADTTSDRALVAAAERGHEDIVTMLLVAGVQAQASQRGRGAALYHAAANGHACIVRRLILAGAKVGYVGGNGDPALAVACKHGHTEVVQLLIDAGALLNDDGSPSPDDILALPARRSAQGDHVEVLELLASHGVGITSAGRYSALRTASSCGSLACVRFLLAHGCESVDVNLALRDAVRRAGNVAIAEELLRNGANLAGASYYYAHPLYNAAFCRAGTTVVQFLCSGVVIDVNLPARRENW